MATRTTAARRGLSPVLVVLAAGWLAGCGPGGPPLGKVEGRVTFRGRPVAGGTVTLSDGKGNGGEAKLGPDGAFAVAAPGGGLPVGEYVVTVTPEMYLDKSDPHTPPAMVEKKARDIPEKYRRDGTTPLRAPVKEGPNDFTFDLLP